MISPTRLTLKWLKIYHRPRKITFTSQWEGLFELTNQKKSVLLKSFSFNRLVIIHTDRIYSDTVLMSHIGWVIMKYKCMNIATFNFDLILGSVGCYVIVWLIIIINTSCLLIDLLTSRKFFIEESLSLGTPLTVNCFPWSILWITTLIMSKFPTGSAQNSTGYRFEPKFKKNWPTMIHLSSNDAFQMQKVRPEVIKIPPEVNLPL